MTRHNHGRQSVRQAMLALIQAFLHIVLRRQGPEHLPDSGFLLALAGAAYVLMQLLVSVPLFNGNGGALVLTIIVDVLLLSGSLAIALRLTRHLPRYRQTLTALFGTGALFSLLAWPFLLWIGTGGNADGGSVVARAAVFAVLLWSITVNGHILARALSAPYFLGLSAAIGYFLLNNLILLRMVPGPG